MKYELDLEQVARRMSELPDEISSLTEVPKGLFRYYIKRNDGFVLDAERRNELVASLTENVEREKLERENMRNREMSDRQVVAEAVKKSMVRANVNPKLLAGAVALFMAQHKFRVRDGIVTVVGKLQAADVERAAVVWASDDGAPFVNPPGEEISGGFLAQIESMKKLH